METAIVVLYYNKSRLTQRCVQSVIEAGYPPKQLYCFDNGSKEAVFQEIKTAFPHCNHLRNQDNLGFSGGFNRSLAHIFTNGYSSAFFLTNDTVLHPGAVENCTRTAAQTGAGMVAPKITYLHKPGTIDSIGAYFETATGTLHHYHETGLPPLLNPAMDYIPGTALWISKEAFQRLGGTDETYHMYWEDVDLSFRGHREGIVQARCYDAHVEHGVGQTTRKKPLYTTFYFHRNRIRFCRRYLAEGELLPVLQSIRSQLTAMGSQWQENDDQRRLGYFQQLMNELDG